MESHTARLEREDGGLVNGSRVRLAIHSDSGLRSWRGSFALPLAVHIEPSETCRLTLDDGRSGAIIYRAPIDRQHERLRPR